MKNLLNNICPETIRIVPFIDGTLSTKQGKNFREHLDHCKECAKFYNKTFSTYQKIDSSVPYQVMSGNDQKTLSNELREFLDYYYKGYKGNKFRWSLPFRIELPFSFLISRETLRLSLIGTLVIIVLSMAI